jgi:hypothetical protein
MYNVGFPYEYGGIAAEEVTTAEVLSEVGYATAFYGKSHLGDVESSYLNNQGFDEALWTPYNQVPSLYTPQIEAAGGIRPGSMYPENLPKDPYDIDHGWRPKVYIWALEGVKGGPVSEWGTPPNLEDYLKLDGEAEKRISKFMKQTSLPLLQTSPVPRNTSLPTALLMESIRPHYCLRVMATAVATLSLSTRATNLLQR